MYHKVTLSFLSGFSENFLLLRRMFVFVFLGKTLYSHGVSLHPRVKMGTSQLSEESEEMLGLTCNDPAD